MRGFLVMCLLAVVRGAPQGYNYPQPTTGTISFAPNIGNVVSSGLTGVKPAFSGSLSGSPSVLSPTVASPGLVGSTVFTPTGASSGLVGSTVGLSAAPTAGVSVGPTIGLPVFSTVGPTGSGLGHVSHVSQHQPQHVVITKNFYIHSGPEETEQEVLQQQISTGPAHKHYRVVFIKAPYQSSRAAALTFAQAQNEEKTVIYVLTKKTDAADIKTAIASAPQVATKPEVYFIKYKTPEEALHAQHQIQAQYDALGGTSNVSDEGLAPVTSVIGTLGQGPQVTNVGSVGGLATNQLLGSTAAPSSVSSTVATFPSQASRLQYLPASA